MSKTRNISAVITPEIEEWLELESNKKGETPSRFVRDVLQKAMEKSKGKKEPKNENQ